jgi:threonine aldolase
MSQERWIDLRSDTVTQPTAAMREAMLTAATGDDVYGEDPTVNALQARLVEMAGKQAGLFMPSGTQSNLVALLTHCGRGDEYIVGQAAHTYRYEGGGAAALGGIQPQPLSMNARGELDLDEVRAAIKPNDPHFARTRLLCLENTVHGRVLSMSYLSRARSLCRENALTLHLDGARLFNASVALGISLRDVCCLADTVSICLSKGLGAPVGSVLLGPADFIEQARRWRKVTGGGMRQAGILAAAGLYALEHHVDRLEEDHQRAARLASGLREAGFPVEQTDTNMVFVNASFLATERLQSTLDAHRVRVDLHEPQRLRMVTHLDISDTDIDTTIAAFRTLRT